MFWGYREHIVSLVLSPNFIRSLHGENENLHHMSDCLRCLILKSLTAIVGFVKYASTWWLLFFSKHIHFQPPLLTSKYPIIQPPYYISYKFGWRLHHHWTNGNTHFVLRTTCQERIMYVNQQNFNHDRNNRHEFYELSKYNYFGLKLLNCNVLSHFTRKKTYNNLGILIKFINCVSLY